MPTLRWVFTLIALFSLCLLPLPTFARERVQGWCEQGSQAVILPGAYPPSTTKVQRSYPSCSVDVFVTGGASGTASVSGTVVTFLTGYPFNPTGVWSGSTITLGSTPFIISA